MQPSGYARPTPQRTNTIPYSRTHPRYQQQRRMPTLRSARLTPSKPALALGAATIALIVLLGVGVVSCANQSPAPLSTAGDWMRSNVSTPTNQWRAGEMPHLYQTDSTWANEPYAGATVGESGCGPTCLTMAYVFLTGRTDYTPATMAAFSERNGYVENGLTAWRLLSEGASQLGLLSEELPASESTVASVLDAGAPIICSMGPGDFTTTGHFIVLCGRDENGNARVFDPNSPERSARTWPIADILPQALNLWALSKA